MKKQDMKKVKHKKAWMIAYITAAALILLLNLAAWSSTAFCDWYLEHIFPVWVNTYGRFMDLFPFSVGEIMLGLGALLAAAALLLWIPFAVSKAIDMAAGKRVVRGAVKTAAKTADKTAIAVEQSGGVDSGEKRSGLRRGICAFYRFFFRTLLAVCLVMTLNCTILYHASTFSENYISREERKFETETQASAGAYTLEELIAVRNLVVEACNELSLEMQRDENGTILYEGSLTDQAILRMQDLGKIYPRLAGYYPHPKPLAVSDFFSQQYMCGYYFPFSMEANYNDVMYIMNLPATMCHELAHLRGYIYEDEANFISYLACIRSEDPVFAYSGYLSVLNYLDNDFYKAVGRNREVYLAQPHILQQVTEDNIFLTQEDWDRINKKAVIDTETVDKVSDTLVEATLKANGVADGMFSYNRVVELLLEYYRESSASLE